MSKRVLAVRGLDQDTYDTFRWRAKAMGMTQPEFLAVLLETHAHTLPQHSYLNATRVPKDASELSANREDA